MKRYINRKEINLGIVCIVVSCAMIWINGRFMNGNSTVLNIICSLIGAGIMLVANGIYIDSKVIYDVREKWKLEKIFRTRAEKNCESDPLLGEKIIRQIDGIAFGLSSFRTARKNDILNQLNRGMNMRLLVMNPNGKFISQREEEGEVLGNISKSITELSKWAEELNSHSLHGHISIKYYNCMTLNFYWRMDDVVYVGPYLYGMDSQQTITYKFLEGGDGFKFYSEYFENLWNSTEEDFQEAVE